jgi:hypothetical protein
MLIPAAQGHRPVMFAEIAMRQALHKNPGWSTALARSWATTDAPMAKPVQAACQGLQYRSLITAPRWGDLALRSPTSSLSGLIRVPTLFVARAVLVCESAMAVRAFQPAAVDLARRPAPP